MKKITNNLKNNPLTYVDLFCGAGGFSLGFEKEGFSNIFSVDFEKSFCKTYRKNFPYHQLVEKNISLLTESEIKDLIGNVKVDVIIGGPPCQGFSLAGNIGRRFIDDPRNHLFKEFVRLVDVIRPDYFVMENVARLFTHNNGKTRDEIIHNFKKLGYFVEVRILNSVDFGVPQVRKRVVFIGTKNNVKIVFPVKSVLKFKTVKDAIGDLPKLQSGKESNIANHIAMKHTKQMLKKMSYISDGGNRDEIPNDIRPKSGDVRKYIKYNSNKPSITITGDMRKVFHYNQNRALTVRELARIQSFPDDFVFEGNSISQQQQVGNAVPPLMAQSIAKSIKGMIQVFGSGQSSLMEKKFPKINFIGNKEKIVSWICDNFPKNTSSIFDAFSGGGAVGYEAKKRGFRVISNDILKINYLLSKSLIENNHEILTHDDISIIFSGKPICGFMYENYANKYFFPEECMELDLYQNNIKKLKSEYKQGLAFVLMRRAMIRKMPYSRFNINWNKIKQLRDENWSYEKYKRRRSYHNKTFKFHFLKYLNEYNNCIFDNGQNNISYNDDVFNVLSKIYADVVYLDPPYTGTMNNYFKFYGVLDEYIMSKKILPFENDFVNKKDSLLLFDKLFASLKNFRYWILSYNNNAYPSKDDLISIISKYVKKVDVIEMSHVYKVTGKEKKKTNKEYLFVMENNKF